ncbi:MAG: haloacid dehalogenase type II [Rhodospirillaceae bacterium]|nr:haloacid dehalogenase type II [Rhodospirillaceae bacterium]
MRGGAITGLLFDVFGTVVDWRTGVARDVAGFFDPLDVDVDSHAFADAWRGKYQPAMKGVRDGARGYVALDTLHLENLETILAEFGLADRVDQEGRAWLNRAWERLPPWPDSVPGLTALKSRYAIATCSNGSIALMLGLARYGGLPWDALLGAEIAQSYKQKPEVYLKSVEAMGYAPDEVMMVAAHNDDLFAAQDAGLRTAFIPRPTEHGPDQTSDLEPTGKWDVVADDLLDLAQQLSD